MADTSTTPNFFSPVVACFGDYCTPVEVPWYKTMDMVGKQTVVTVITEDIGPRPAGMYILDGLVWKLALTYALTVSLSNFYKLTVRVKSTTGASYSPGTLVYKNSAPTLDNQMLADPNAVWVIAEPVGGTGGGGGGGDGTADLIMTNTPIDSPAVAGGEPIINLYNDGAISSTMNMQVLRSVGGVNLGMVVVKVTDV